MAGSGSDGWARDADEDAAVHRVDDETGCLHQLVSRRLVDCEVPDFVGEEGCDGLTDSFVGL